jgi:uncharacterized protein (DUF2141 family)/uncharacterized membrane protein
MLGIPGLDWFGAMHAAFGLAALALGLGVVLLPKGTALHRRIGLLYAATMLVLNATALAIYDLFGGFGVFHWLALVSLGTLAAGVLPVWLRRPRDWLELHARFMSWSYAGLVAAFFAEIGARLPGVGFTMAVLVPTIGVMLAAAVLIHVRVPRVIARIALLLLLMLGGAALAAQEGTRSVGTLTVRVTGFSHGNGTAMVALTDARGFLGKGPAVRTESLQIRDGRVTAVFKDVPYGGYAIQAYHDENGNRRLDRNFFGIPSEPYGFSNGARSSMGPPRYEAAEFTLATDARTVNVTVQ